MPTIDGGMIGIGLVGYGYWGRNLARNIQSCPGCTLTAIADAGSDRRAAAAMAFPSATILSDATGLIMDPRIDAVVLATPVASHHPLALKALKAGKHVLVEKPMTASVAQAAELIDASQAAGRWLMTDHTFLYTGAVRKMKELIGQGRLGSVRYFDSTRINLGIFQADVNVVWDLAPHDLSILFHLIDERPVSVSAHGIAHLQNGIENIAYVNLNFQSDLMAHFTCSWSSPVKIRQILVGGDKSMILYDDNQVTEKVKVYDSGFMARPGEERDRVLVDYRIGDIHVPKVETTEALQLMIRDFVDAISLDRAPVADAASGMDVVRVLEAAQDSIKNKGRETKIHKI